MKVGKLLSLDQETVERLKQEPNASAVVEEALAAHYEGKTAYRRLVELAGNLEDYGKLSYRLNDLQDSMRALLEMARR